MSQYTSPTPEQGDNIWAPPPRSTTPQPSAPPPPPPSTPHAQTAVVSPSAPVARAWPYASWAARVGARLIDELLLLIGVVPYVIGAVLLITNSPGTTSGGSTVAYSAGNGDASMALAGLLLVLLGGLLIFVLWLWNRVFRMGRTGQSVGKSVMGLYLVSERTGNPMGVGMCFVREIAQYANAIFYLGYLWPLWDEKRQTFADKIVSTVVAQGPRQEF